MLLGRRPGKILQKRRLALNVTYHFTRLILAPKVSVKMDGSVIRQKKVDIKAGSM